MSTWGETVDFHSPRTYSSLLLVQGAASFAFLYLLLWVPTWFGATGWLFMYPIFLIAWVPVELILVAAAIVSVVHIAREANARRAIAPGAWLELTAALMLALLSLPLLWFGNPFALL